ncbi:hypothetical protein O3Q52_08175 [Streptomyces sp. ActVer]|uniref:hypothetical protein n=1 Tax=Streptomyces europaeiscabiei TaxID=146819 RepID=UPI0022CAADE5|nr:hypothetical protein [Streptomyces europaeiscabiei]MCZ4508179.1 hypothetical protein [Streptomyces sp. ActVer]MDX2530826.1 hypothetical protein [Streptomyces europaeiscabiei]
MSVDRTGIQDVHALWLQTLDFLHYNAPQTWADMLQQEGVTFLMPPAVAALERAQDQAAALANAERRRLRKADLFYITREAAASVMELTDVPCIAQIASIVPSPSGLMVWEEPPVRIERGVVLRAVSWGPSYDGGTWWSWWTDTAACVRAGIAEPTMLMIHGGLTFHEEVHTEPDFWPVQADDPALPEHLQFRALLFTWMAISCGLLVYRESVGPSQDICGHLRRTGVESRAVHRVIPASGSDRPGLAQILRRQLQLDGATTEERPYPGYLPARLAPWHVYVPGLGHRLIVEIPSLEPGQTAVPTLGAGRRVGNLAFAPVRAVLRQGWQFHNGYVQSPLHYDPELGLLTDPDDDEF